MDKPVMKPTIGRQVWFFGIIPVFAGDVRSPNRQSEQPMAATVVHVWGDRCVNLDVIDHAGQHWAVSSCTLLQDGEKPVGHSYWAEWMPYQKGQAARTEAAEAKVVETKTNADGITFGAAIRHLKDGDRVARQGWNGKGMFLFLVPGSTFKVSRPPLLGIYPEGTEINYHGHIDMKTADGMVVPWLASQTDMLAEDWMVL